MAKMKGKKLLLKEKMIEKVKDYQIIHKLSDKVANKFINDFCAIIDVNLDQEKSKAQIDFNDARFKANKLINKFLMKTLKFG
jgi:uncharacterized pyridoxal phosphate-containing UPF0001 family protein